jgi:hypothetical protein
MSDLKTAAQRLIDLEDLDYGESEMLAQFGHRDNWLIECRRARDNLRAALEQKPKFTLSCGCPSQYGGVPAYWERDGTRFGAICEKHWHEYGARSEA